MTSDGKSNNINCCIAKGIVFYRTGIINESVFKRYENGTLRPAFIMYHVFGNVIEKYIVGRNECMFGNVKKFKETNPELFI